MATPVVPPDQRKPLGRPSSYTTAIGDAICERIATGQSLNTICREAHMPVMMTIWNWIRDHPEFLAKYQRAREEQADALSEQMLDDVNEEPDKDEFGKVDAGAVAHKRLRVDVLKWRAGRLKPKVYGDKVQQEHTGAGGGPIRVITGVPLTESREQSP